MAFRIMSARNGRMFGRDRIGVASRLLRWGVFGLILTVTACGGGGGGGGTNPIPTPPPDGGSPPPSAPTVGELNEAAKLASVSTFGLPYDALYALAETGFDSWLQTQFNTPATLHKPVIDDLEDMLANGELAANRDANAHRKRFRRYAWWNRAMTAPDVLRQRVAFALSEIFVVSDQVAQLNNNPYALSTYYDQLLTHAFTNYRDLLEAVALHPAMGVYLSHVNNPKADPDANQFPDENFAREVMQLFSIGLFELNADGSEKLDDDGQPIPSYNNDTIREMARVFTGLSFGGPNARFGKRGPVFQVPMQMFDEFHEPGEKVLLNDVVVPAGQTGMQDIEMALDNLFNHPNVGPFIGRQLIQRLVMSNPPPAYVARVSAAFNGDSSGVRGDMRAVIEAVLTDPEVVSPSDPETAGRLREPLVRFVSMARQLNAVAEDGLFYNNGYAQQFLLRQHPLSAPSVFNFYLPNHSPAGPLAQAGLVAPEFQITDTTSIVTVTNAMYLAVIGNQVMDIEPPFGAVSLDLTAFEDLNADSLDALLDRLDTVFMHGTMEATTRQWIADIALEVEDMPLRTRVAIYMTLASANYAVNI